MGQIAILFEGDEPGEVRRITYKQLSTEVNKTANALKALGIKKGDTVCFYMPMIPEAAFAMLACTRIGAPHSVVFAGFSAESLRDRILDGNCDVVLTADEGVRGGKKIPLKATVDTALKECKNVRKVLVFQRTKKDVPMTPERDVFWGDLVSESPAVVLHPHTTTPLSLHPSTPPPDIHTHTHTYIYIYRPPAAAVA